MTKSMSILDEVNLIIVARLSCIRYKRYQFRTPGSQVMAHHVPSFDFVAIIVIGNLA